MSDPIPVNEQLQALDVSSIEYATQFVELLLAEATRLGASDVHLQPQGEALDIAWRLDGVLQPLGSYSPGQSSHVITRLKVLAELLTYRSDLPQEGRIRAASNVEMRVSTMPTLHGERAVIRLFAPRGQHLRLPDLGMEDDNQKALAGLLLETAGVILITGPAGSGKTTTAYALLREIAQQSPGSKCLVSLEDPIEVDVPGMAQSEVNNAAGFDMATGIRSMLRQDPEVIFVGEIRDRETAECALQAALTGHLVITTFHAGSTAEAISRLSDMDIEPYVLRSCLLGIVNQRLVRRLCACAQPVQVPDGLLGLAAASALAPGTCPDCAHTGYRGRHMLSELLLLDHDGIAQAILTRRDARQLELLAKDSGMITRWQRAITALEQGITSPTEIRRVLGFSEN